ncbi:MULTISPECIES: EAL domain-containing protein [Chromobacterium]|uniref:EAL domain-containing protein n=1 Tax=Chromobacterium rhizoryzae TaxID=1778675 RepID=A0AAD0RV28_9NEIS|nr:MULTISPECIES: EAL domain-containing protein [Chromobacterium]AXT48659.1 EAL domain-containing protein [Chromobacterium rhizoryzae]OQS34791.1 EAL domain-containing protein [Chromobacterium haemolyticum]QOD82639.1 EAL domain-containing protein [Chromobacterium haemolyticum]
MVPPQDPHPERQLYRDADGRYCARLGGYQFSSVFQPLFYRSGGVFGYEALLRVRTQDGQTPPPDAFLSGLTPELALEADQLARLIHIRNFAQSGQSGCLSLNLLAQTAVVDNHGRSHLPLLQGLLDSLELDSAGVIFELPEYEVEHHGQPLINSLRLTAEAGFGLSVDDFGAVAARHGKVKSLCPDLIKIDRSLLLDYMSGERHRLPVLLELGWQIGCRMAVEGIESREQHLAMQELGVELYQGFYLGKPAELPVTCQL